MNTEVIIITPSQLTPLLVEALGLALTFNLQRADDQSKTDQWLTIEELSNYLPGKPAITTLYGKVQRREIPFKRMGKRLVFLQSEIDIWLKSKHCKTQTEISTVADKYLTSKRGRK